MPSSDKVYWLKWNTTQVLKWDFFTKRWSPQNQIKPAKQNFLFFSSVAHLPKGLGMFVLGGSDQMDNFSRRVTLFSKYERFLEKPMMLMKRAFFASIFCISDSCLYAIGGNDGDSDLSHCERYSIQENMWRPAARLHVPRNGASVVAFDRVIFAFGGNNSGRGSLDTIERYAIEFDKWSLPRVRLKEPIHDSAAFNIGGARVLILGGHNNTKPNDRFDIYDLTTECCGPEENKIENGKMFVPPAYDEKSGFLNTYIGYGDSTVLHAEKLIKGLMCTCRSVTFCDNAMA